MYHTCRRGFLRLAPVFVLHWVVESCVVRPAILIVPLLLLSACGEKPDRAGVLGSAYAGPATLRLRKDLPLQSPVVATVRHGDRLDIVRRHRRSIRVRAPNGAEGWTEEHLLLSAQDLATLRAFEAGVKRMPSQGVASTYEPMNVHTEPDRRSPSFIQLKENEKFDMIAHRLAPRTSQPRKPLIPAAVKTAPAPKKKSRDGGRIPPPEAPQPPGPPPNWIELSRTPPELAAEFAAARQPKPVPMEDWSLIRTRSGESGWVLTRRLFMAIPDEVAQYAEGRRITGYFPLGDVRDGDTLRHHWLWTTIGASAANYDFDSFRVFIWNARRHRFETAYIERNLKGYFPVQLEQVAYGAPARSGGAAAAAPNQYPGFSVCMERKDGARVRRRYAFLTNIVRFAGEQPCQPAAIENPQIPIETFVASAGQPETPGANRSLLDRVKGRIGALRKRWFGK